MATPLWFFDEALDDAYENDYWLEEAMSAPAISSNDLFADLTLYDFETEFISRDVDVFVEYYDHVEDSYGRGIIRRWVTDPYLDGDDEEYAYIQTERGGFTYALDIHIHPICEVTEYDSETQRTLPVWVSPAVSNAIQETRRYMGELQQPAMLPAPAATTHSVGVAS